MLGTLLESRGEIDDLIALYEENLRRQEDSLIAQNNLAMMLLTYRQDDAAALSRAAELAEALAGSGNLAYRDTAGWAFTLNGEPARAVPLLEGVVTEAPDVAEFRYHLGAALFRAGDQQAAIAQLERATEGDPRYRGVEEARRILEQLRAG